MKTAKNTMKYLNLVILACLLTLPVVGKAERIKDLASIAGVRSNQLVGYGLVVGLDGSGDQTSQTPFTVQSLENMLKQFGINLPPGVNPQLKNIAAVSVHADLPAFAKPGQTIDITVSSIGNAKALRGGSLLMTPMKGADGKVYAIAQGNLIVSGFGASADGSSITVNIPSVGRIPNGATVERAVPNPFGKGPHVVLNLHTADFTTATRMATSINQTIGPATAHAIDATSVRVNAPLDSSQRVAYVALLESLQVEPGDAAAKVIVNSRTGTVVIGQNVRVKPAAVSHGSLVVTISANPIVSQPAPFSRGGQTAVVPQSDIEITEENNRMFLFEPGVSLGEIVRAVNEVGAAPGDLVAILEALKQSGSLKAELIVI
jgi:flagellar P-ring protein precursor FlgI